ncbi:MAG: hypothetical protein J6R59_02770 [Paludibacteraceae bacterium]|nr:hypothetical protein [Paludibacteraceae bacterium]
MFDSCYRLQSLSIKSWDDSYAEYEGLPYGKNAPYMFYGCYNLSSDDIVSTVCKMTQLEDGTYMFAESSLTTYPFTMNERLN